jgi:trk/ktr system potassium uptake protein
MLQLLTKISPARLTVVSFIGLITIGTLLLMLPFCGSHGSLTLLEAFFTSTSAVCVTGLAVVDTGQDFSTFGQIVLLILIQLGGLGMMVLSSSAVVLFGGTLGLKEKSILKATIPGLQFSGVGTLLRGTVIFTIAIEAIGAVLLFILWGPQIGWLRACGYGIFHSVSAFCNAGFSLWSNSLMDYSDQAGVNLVVMALIIFGGFGFLLCSDVWLARSKGRRPTLHSRLALRVSLLLVVLGAIFFFLFERNNPLTLGPMSGSGQFWASLFQSVTTRTAGFNSVDLSGCQAETLEMMMFLMLIGGCPGSTAGGLKTTTLAVLILAIYNNLKGRSKVVVMERVIPNERVVQALAILGIMFAASWLGAITLSSLEPSAFQDNLFETVSAVGTVGLSTGITANLSTGAKLLLCLYMFMGRVGPLTLAVSLLTRSDDKRIGYVSEDITIG